MHSNVTLLTLVAPGTLIILNRGLSTIMGRCIGTGLVSGFSRTLALQLEVPASAKIYFELHVLHFPVVLFTSLYVVPFGQCPSSSCSSESKATLQELPSPKLLYIFKFSLFPHQLFVLLLVHLVASSFSSSPLLMQTGDELLPGYTARAIPCRSWFESELSQHDFGARNGS